MRIRKNTNISLQLSAAAIEYSDPSLAQRTCPVNQSPWDAVLSVNQPEIFTQNGNASLADSIGAQVNQPGIFTGHKNPIFVDFIGAQVNRPGIFSGHGNPSLADSIGAQLNQPGIFTGHKSTSLADSMGTQVNQATFFNKYGKASLADSIGAQVTQPTIFTKNGNASYTNLIKAQQRGASKENPVLLDEDENLNDNGDKKMIKKGDENGENNGIKKVGGDEYNSEDNDIPVFVVFGNEKRSIAYCESETQNICPIKGSFALCKCHGPQPICKCHRPKQTSGKTKTLNLLPVKKIYKPICKCHAYGNDGFYYYSGFAPGCSGSKDDGEESDVLK